MNTLFNKRFTYKHIALSMMLFVTLLFPMTTSAYYSDLETTSGNSWTAGILDLILSLSEFEGVITNDPGDEVQFDQNVSLLGGSFDAQYDMSYEFVSGTPAVCNALTIATNHGAVSYDGELTSLSTTPTDDYGLWPSYITVTDGESVPTGVSCTFDIVYSAWLEEVSNIGDSGFYDIERLRVTINTEEEASPVVLNEFLPNPDGHLCSDLENDDCDPEDPDYIGYYGKDSSNMPYGEWVELYNLTGSPIDLDGWYVEDASGGVGNTDITTGNTLSGTTTIPANGYLVIFMNKPVWNNTGDTVKLFNPSDVLQDSYAYTSDYDFCYLEPTQGSENIDTSAGGDIDCTPGSNIPANKSYARIPDGTGSWIDPIPTPGIPNTLENELTDEQKALILIAATINTLNDELPEVEEVEEALVINETAKPEEAIIPEDPETEEDTTGGGEDEDTTEDEVEEDVEEEETEQSVGGSTTPPVTEEADSEIPEEEEVPTEETEEVPDDESVEEVVPEEEAVVSEEEPEVVEEVEEIEEAPVEEEVVEEEIEEEEAPVEEEPEDIPSETETI